MTTPAGVYISVPFCKAKCTFCNFASDAFGSGRMQGYVDRLCMEIRESRPSAEKMSAILPHQVDSIYFGGGTPSLLTPEQFRQIFEALHDQFEVARNPEITLECAPGQLANDTLDELLRQGMNRISFGVQSFVDRESSAVGRLHTAEQCIAEIARVRSVGIEEIGLDLIAGLPHQTEQSWRYSLDQAIATGVPHLSVYMLEVDEESRLGKEILAGGARYHASAVPSEDDAAVWYQIACEAFDAAGIAQYEISNFARHGHASRHNLKYWHREPYIGFGLDAHSMLLSNEAAVRFANTSDLDVYLNQTTTANPPCLHQLAKLANANEVDIIGYTEAFEESLFLGLRLNEGVSIESLRQQFGETMLQDTMESLQEVHDAGLLEIDAERIRLTPRGRMVSNEVFSRVLVSAAA
ncbi:oxygen-independent coproporphyrinogen-3 oxidase [Edaphobacter aggregans]|uniref:Heme chaperone HemW n=1 Tax=Edaphobacter aggregans TaxID=570835 RepID=A0A428MF36_9BACT|nr:radical SAM family heme chaperone HemW [Edaphobacter aggregans]RSL15442.1 oxygen-independent coproporphyrinogen-3 oxidase [Edaphobacter aggregans]